MKKVNLDTTLYDLTEEFPDLIPVLAALGFRGVTDENMRTTHAKVMTIRTGCDTLGIDRDTVVVELKKLGYEIIGS